MATATTKKIKKYQALLSMFLMEILRHSRSQTFSLSNRNGAVTPSLGEALIFWFQGDVMLLVGMALLVALGGYSLWDLLRGMLPVGTGRAQSVQH